MECGHCTGLIKVDCMTGQKWIITKNGYEFNSFIQLTNLETGETINTYKTSGLVYGSMRKRYSFERYVSEAKYNWLKKNNQLPKRKPENE